MLSKLTKASAQLAVSEDGLHGKQLTMPPLREIQIPKQRPAEPRVFEPSRADLDLNADQIQNGVHGFDRGMAQPAHIQQQIRVESAREIV